MIRIDPRARAAWRFLPERLPLWAIVVGPCGEVVRVRVDGGVDPVLPGGHPRGGIAADPVPHPQPPE